MVSVEHDAFYTVLETRGGTIMYFGPVPGGCGVMALFGQGIGNRTNFPVLNF